MLANVATASLLGSTWSAEIRHSLGEYIVYILAEACFQGVSSPLDGPPSAFQKLEAIMIPLVR